MLFNHRKLLFPASAHGASVYTLLARASLAFAQNLARQYFQHQQQAPSQPRRLLLAWPRFLSKETGWRAVPGWFAVVVLLFCTSGCIEPYAPEVVSAPNSYLVVNGFINGTGSTTISLSRSLSLEKPNTFPAESRATVTVQSLGGRRYPLPETDTLGRYRSVGALALPAGEQYRLHIRTAAGREYASEYTPLKQTPALDAVDARIEPQGLQIRVSTHDERGQTQYYRWEYDQTWEFTAAFESLLAYRNKQVVERSENIYNCWRTEKSTGVNVFSTVRLSQDAVRDYRLLFIPSSSSRLRYKYSILVRQYAISRDEFDYWEAVKKNTENLGTLFDPLPSQVQGNVRCLTDPTEPVLGFVGATTEVNQRIFVSRLQLPNEWWFINEGYEQCRIMDSIPNRRNWTIDMYLRDSTRLIPIGYILGGYTAQTPECADCRLRGTNVKPSFWR